MPPAPLGFNPADPALKFDLVIANADVLDPSQRLRGKRDVGIKNGQIAALAPGIAPDRAVQRIDAGGRLVTPGLIDLHTHLMPHIGIGLPADELVGITAVTTAISAGDAGANTFGAFTHWARPQTRTRLYAFVHIASIGLAGGLAPGELLNIDYAIVDACAKTVAENADVVLGVKVRITDSVVGQNGLEPLRRAIRAAAMAGPQFRVMCHIGAAPGSMSDLLDLLRPGDILTHAYSGAGNNIVQNGQLLAAAKAAKQRGVIFDVGHGGGSFDFTVCEPAIQQGATADTISSDIHAVSINTPGYPTLPNVMSKFLALGMPLEEVVARHVGAREDRGQGARSGHAPRRRSRRHLHLRCRGRAGGIRGHAQQQAHRRKAVRAVADRQGRAALGPTTHARPVHLLIGRVKTDLGWVNLLVGFRTFG
jgi:dihydroorotase